MWIFNWFKSTLEGLGLMNKNAKIVFLGLDDAGKTTLLLRLKEDVMKQMDPTQQPYSEELVMGNIPIIQEKSDSKLGIWEVTKLPEKPGEIMSLTWMELYTWSILAMCNVSNKVATNSKVSSKCLSWRKFLSSSWAIKSTKLGLFQRTNSWKLLDSKIKLLIHGVKVKMSGP